MCFYYSGLWMRHGRVKVMYFMLCLSAFSDAEEQAQFES